RKIFSSMFSFYLTICNFSAMKDKLSNVIRNILKYNDKNDIGRAIESLSLFKLETSSRNELDHFFYTCASARKNDCKTPGESKQEDDNNENVSVQVTEIGSFRIDSKLSSDPNQAEKIADAIFNALSRKAESEIDMELPEATELYHQVAQPLSEATSDDDTHSQKRTTEIDKRETTTAQSSDEEAPVAPGEVTLDDATTKTGYANTTAAQLSNYAAPAAVTLDDDTTNTEDQVSTAAQPSPAQQVSIVATPAPAPAQNSEMHSTQKATTYGENNQNDELPKGVTSTAKRLAEKVRRKAAAAAAEARRKAESAAAELKRKAAAAARRRANQISALFASVPEVPQNTPSIPQPEEEAQKPLLAELV
ncbi:MAG: hypothetical protein AAF621_05895, partial [Pseudomonadota bacterium]